MDGSLKEKPRSLSVSGAETATSKIELRVLIKSVTGEIVKKYSDKFAVSELVNKEGEMVLGTKTILVLSDGRRFNFWLNMARGHNYFNQNVDLNDLLKPQSKARERYRLKFFQGEDVDKDFKRLMELNQTKVIDSYTAGIKFAAQFSLENVFGRDSTGVVKIKDNYFETKITPEECLELLKMVKECELPVLPIIINGERKKPNKPITLKDIMDRDVSRADIELPKLPEIII